MLLRQQWKFVEGWVFLELLEKREGERGREEEEGKEEEEWKMFATLFHAYWLHFYHHPVQVSHSNSQHCD